MTAISRYLGREIGDHVMGQGTRDYTPPTDITVRGYHVAPDDSGNGGTELSYVGYLPISTDEADWNLATTQGLVTNKTLFAFPAPPSDQPAMVALALWDQLGNLLWTIDLLDQSIPLKAGVVPEFIVGDIQVDWVANTTGMSHYLGKKLADHVFQCGTANFTSPATIYVAGYTTAPNDADTVGTESTYGAYARQLSVAADWNPAASNGDIGNLGTFTFPVPTSDDAGEWEEVALRDASSGGNLLLHAALTIPATGVTPRTGDRPRFGLGAMVFDWNAE